MSPVANKGLLPLVPGTSVPSDAAAARTSLGLGDAKIFLKKVTVGFAQLSAAGTSIQVILLSLPANSVMLDARMIVGQSGVGTATLTLSVGLAASSVKYMAAQDAKAAALTAYTGVANGNGVLEANAVNLIAEAVSTVQNLNALSQGSWDFYITYRVLP